MEIPALVWSVLYYLGLFVGAYVLTAIGFLLFARLEKDQGGSLLIDPESLSGSVSGFIRMAVLVLSAYDMEVVSNWFRCSVSCSSYFCSCYGQG